jgi:nicotinamidase-related amidase
VPEPRLADLVEPGRTAVVTQECQVGVIGAEAVLGDLAQAAGRAVPNIARIVERARTVGAAVVHCLAERRPDGRGGNSNARLFRAMARLQVPIETGTSGAALVPELGPDPGDVVLRRLHGIGPMGGTDLDAVLRNLGVTTIVATGVSVNIAITNLVMDAVNAGYDVVLARDAVAGVPADYADAVIEHTLSLLAAVVTTDELLDAWEDHPAHRLP